MDLQLPLDILGPISLLPIDVYSLLISLDPTKANGIDQIGQCQDHEKLCLSHILSSLSPF